MPDDKTPTQELFWLYRLKQSGLFEPETPQGALLQANPLHDPLTCPQCSYGPCSWLSGQLEIALKPAQETDTPVA